MKMHKYFLLTLLFCSSISYTIAQNRDVKKQVKYGLTGLTIWGGTSFALGLGIRLTAKNDFDKNYGITHAAWGGINGAIGVIALSTFNKSFEKKGYSHQPSKQLEFSKSFQGVYLINALLDIGYAAVGYFTWRSGFNSQKFSTQLQITRKAVGNASMIQATGLFMYDILMFRMMRKNIRLIKKEGISVHPHFKGINICYSW